MNNKGFTLTELIVTIAIMGVITGIAYPIITKLQTEHAKDLYETYEKSIETGAKLYVDKYSRDIFDVDKDNYYKVKYETLKSENFVKDFKQKKNVNVDLNNTYVIITRQANDTNVVYKTRLKLTNGGGIVYDSGDKCPSGKTCSIFP